MADDDSTDRPVPREPLLLRAVIDTNVFVSEIINPAGPPGQILQVLRHRKFTLITSPAINEEILEVLSRPRLQKYGLRDSLFDIGVILYAQAELVQEKTQVKASPDPDDDKFLAAAVDGRAQYVVTGDKSDLLHLEKYRDVRVISCRAFYAFCALLRLNRGVNPATCTIGVEELYAKRVILKIPVQL